jgi:hypothetical protein
VAAAAFAMGGLAACQEPGGTPDAGGPAAPSAASSSTPSVAPSAPSASPTGGTGGGGAGPAPSADGAGGGSDAPAGGTPAPGGSEDVLEGDPSFMAPGEMYRYPNGLEVTLHPAERYTPTVGSEHDARVYRFRVTVDNYGDTTNEAIFGFSAHAGGTEAVEIHDPALAVEPVGALAPGGHFEAYVVFDVPAGPDLLDVTVDPLGVDKETIYWILPL